MQKTTSQNGIAHLPVVVAIVATFAVSAVGFSVYRVQQANQAVPVASEDDKLIDESDIAFGDQVDLTKVRVSQDEKSDSDLEPPKPAESTTPAPAPKSTSPSPKPKKTEQSTTQKPKPSVKQVSISSTSVEVDASTVVFSASLPGSYQGTCKALVKRNDGSDARWYDDAFSGNQCSVTADRSKLPGGDWQFYMYFYASDGSVKGSSGPKSFNL